jgi:RHH-type transcriptional regulator, rel operon repressor / antitoxin RelB
MSSKTLTFRTAEEKVSALDSVAALQQRDRSFILNEAVDQYLSLYDYHTSLIQEGIRQADAGELIPHSEIRKMAATWAKKRKH